MRCNFQNQWVMGTSQGNGLFYTWSLSSWKTNRALGFAVSVRAECVCWSSKRVFYIPRTHPLKVFEENIHWLVLCEMETDWVSCPWGHLSQTVSHWQLISARTHPMEGFWRQFKLPLVMALLIRLWMGWKYLPALNEWLYCILWQLISLLLRTQAGIVAGKAHNGFVVITLCLMPYQVNIT